MVLPPSCKRFCKTSIAFCWFSRSVCLGRKRDFRSAAIFLPSSVLAMASWMLMKPILLGPVTVGEAMGAAAAAGGAAGLACAMAAGARRVAQQPASTRVRKVMMILEYTGL